MELECIVCKLKSKYKCSICRQPYCSVACCKVHKSMPCSALPPPASEDPPPPREYDFPTEDTVPEEKLKLLEQSTELCKCLGNPHLRTLLEDLDRCEHPDTMIKEYMQEPIFTEFVDACLRVVTDVDDSKG